MNPYIILGVQPTASEDEIADAYRALAKKHHPDRGGCDEKMREVNAAYEILSDPARRQRYDETGDTGDIASEAQRNLLGLFHDMVRNYAPGVDIIKQLRCVVENNLREFHAQMAQCQKTGEVLAAMKARIIHLDDGPNLFADIVQGEIDRLGVLRKQLESSVKMGDEMMKLLEAYSFKPDAVRDHRRLAMASDEGPAMSMWFR